MHFNQLKLDTAFDDEALKHILRQNIQPDLFMGAIKQSPNVEDTLAGWEAALRSYDKHRRSFEAPRVSGHEFGCTVRVAILIGTEPRS